MPTIDITDDERERIERLREEIQDVHGGPYATVETSDVLTYLLDLADAVDDPERQAASDDRSDDASEDEGFPRERLRARLEDRNRKHADPDDEPRMDLYTIAAEYDIAGRSEMTKDELVEAVLDVAERLYADPFAPVDVEFDEAADTDGDDSETDGDDLETDGDDLETDATDANGDGKTDEGDGADAADGGSGQLDAMLSLLDTHDDKWREADGDARYEVDLPDGTTESARTKDDVRALLFKNY
ncbi:hypothetical protein JCM18237_19230 [Halorubrum luteum]